MSHTTSSGSVRSSSPHSFLSTDPASLFKHRAHGASTSTNASTSNTAAAANPTKTKQSNHLARPSPLFLSKPLPGTGSSISLVDSSAATTAVPPTTPGPPPTTPGAVPALRAHLGHLLPRHAYFRATVQIHQVQSVPFVSGEFGVRWKLKGVVQHVPSGELGNVNGNGNGNEGAGTNVGGTMSVNGASASVPATPTRGVFDRVRRATGAVGVAVGAADKGKARELNDQDDDDDEEGRRHGDAASGSRAGTPTPEDGSRWRRGRSKGHAATFPIPTSARPSTSTFASAASESKSMTPSSAGTRAIHDETESGYGGHSNSYSSTTTTSTTTTITNSNTSTTTTTGALTPSLPFPLPPSTALSTPARGCTPFLPLKDHGVTWSHTLSAVLKLSADRQPPHLLHPCPLKLVVMQKVDRDDPGGVPQNPRLGAVYLDLAEYVGKGWVERRYLLKESKTNATLRISIHLSHIGGTPTYTAPALAKGDILMGIAGFLDQDLVKRRVRGLEGLDFGPYRDKEEMERDLFGGRGGGHDEGEDEDSGQESGEDEEEEEEESGDVEEFYDAEDGDGHQHESRNDARHGDNRKHDHNHAYTRSASITTGAAATTARRPSGNDTKEYLENHPHTRNYKSKAGEESNNNNNNNEIGVTFDVQRLPFAYGTKTTETLIEALFNPQRAETRRAVGPFTYYEPKPPKAKGRSKSKSKSKSTNGSSRRGLGLGLGLDGLGAAEGGGLPGPQPVMRQGSTSSVYTTGTVSTFGTVESGTSAATSASTSASASTSSGTTSTNTNRSGGTGVKGRLRMRMGMGMNTNGRGKDRNGEDGENADVDEMGRGVQRGRRVRSGEHERENQHGRGREGGHRDGDGDEGDGHSVGGDSSTKRERGEMGKGVRGWWKRRAVSLGRRIN